MVKSKSQMLIKSPYIIDRALELLICVPRPESVEIKSPKTAGLGFSERYSSSSTPSHQLSSQNNPVYPTQSTPALQWDQSRTSDISGRFQNTRSSPYAELYSHTSRADRSEGNGAASTSSASAHVHFAPTNDISILSLDERGQFRHGGGLEYEESWDEEDEDSYLLAKSLFDHHQWDRCAALLENRKVQGAKALFLKLYARYLVSPTNNDSYRLQLRHLSI